MDQLDAAERDGDAGAAETAEAAAAETVEDLYVRIAATPCDLPGDIAYKLRLAWQLQTGSASAPAQDADAGERLLWSAFQDALRLARR